MSKWFSLINFILPFFFFKGTVVDIDFELNTEITESDGGGGRVSTLAIQRVMSPLKNCSSGAVFSNSLLSDKNRRTFDRSSLALPAQLYPSVLFSRSPSLIVLGDLEKLSNLPPEIE